MTSAEKEKEGEEEEELLPNREPEIVPQENSDHPGLIISPRVLQVVADPVGTPREVEHLDPQAEQEDLQLGETLGVTQDLHEEEEAVRGGGRGRDRSPRTKGKSPSGKYDRPACNQWLKGACSRGGHL